jgi:hypothetical protein
MNEHEKLNTPWRLDTLKDCIRDADGKKVLSAEAEEGDVPYLDCFYKEIQKAIKRVNLYDELVKALGELAQYHDSLYIDRRTASMEHAEAAYCKARALLERCRKNVK